MKKACSAVLSILLCFMLCFGAFAESAELRTVVPSSHEITVVYNEGGRIIYDGDVIASGSKITVDRFDDVILAVMLNTDSHLKTVTVNGEDVTADVLYGRLTLAGVHTDMKVEFTFEKCHDDLPNGEPDPDETCTHISMSGGVYKGKKKMPRAKLEFDYGEIVVSADKNGAYKIDDIKDGYHIVRILNEDGTPAGDSDFAINISSEATEVKVERLPDGMRLVTVPRGNGNIRLNFVLADDGSGDVDIVPAKTSDKPGSNPIISNTSAMLRENPMVFGILLVFSFLVFVILLVRRRRKDEEEEPA